MKKLYQCLISILAGLVAGALISSAVYAVTGFSIFGRIRNKMQSPDEVVFSELTATAYATLDCIKERDFAELARFVHPELGVTFSPNATVTPSTNKRFSAEEIAAFSHDTSTYIWGVYSAGGEPIELTVAEYFSRFVFCKDYTTAPYLGVNSIVRSSNALENITEVFPNVQYIDFHIPRGERGSIDDYEWSSLRLGFEEYDGRLWLMVITHCKWSV